MAKFFDNKGVQTAATLSTGGVSDLFGYGIVDDVGRTVDPTKTEHVDSFVAPEFTRAEEFENNYQAQFDPNKAAGQLTDLEKQLNITAFDKDEYVKGQTGALRAGVDEGVREHRSSRGDNAANRGFLSSGTAVALDEDAIDRGERTFQMGAADIDQAATGMKLGEDARRTNTAGEFAGINLGNERYMHEAEVQEYGINEGNRRYDQESLYGQALDDYELNEVAPAQRREDRKAGVISGAASLGGSVLSAAGKIAPAAIAACRIAEATFGVDHPATNRARYRVNVQWPVWAKALYIRHMDRAAAFIRRHPAAKLVTKPLFYLIGLGSREMGPEGQVR